MCTVLMIIDGQVTEITDGCDTTLLKGVIAQLPALGKIGISFGRIKLDDVKVTF